MLSKKAMKYICLVLLVSVFYSSTLIVQSHATGNQGYANGKMFNEYVEYAVADNGGNNGRFTIGTTSGDPNNINDDNLGLLYGHPNPSSSFTTLKVDGIDLIFNPNSQYPTPNESDLSNISEQTIGNISVKQKVSIVTNTGTGRDDIVQIKYIVKNNDTINHQIGLRMLMDIKVGNNDGAPFRIPGIGAVTNETELTGSSIPEYWQVFDNFSSPTIIAQGSLYDSLSYKPDKIQICNWGGIQNNLWNYVVNTGSSISDSAIGIYWNPKTIAAGQTIEYVTYYGITEFAKDMTTPLALMVTGANSVSSNECGYYPNPFTVTAYIMNNSSIDIINVRTNIVLPQGLRLKSGQTAQVSLGTLGPGQERQVSWLVEIDNADTSRNLSYSVTVGADNAQTKTVSKDISIPALRLGEWVTMNSMPTARSGLAVAEANGKIYAIGGTSTVKVEEYDPYADVWATKANMPTGRVYLAAASVNGKIYAIGGDLQLDSGNYTNKVEEYDPTTNTWTTKANMPTARYALSAVALNGKIYAIGGYNTTGGNLKTLEEYDPITNTWTTKASMSQARYCFGVGVVNGKIYVAGGYNGSSYLNSLEEYDPSTDTWTTKASMPTARFALVGATLNGRFYAISGKNSSSQVDTVEVYDYNSDTWSTAPSIITARRYAGGVSYNNKIYVFGGLNPSSSAVGNNEVYILPVDENIPSIPTGLTASAATTSITVSWNKIPYAKSYDIEIDGGLIINTTNTSYLHSQLNPNTQHTYRVRSINVAGISDWSSILAKSTNPVAPTGEWSALTNMPTARSGLAVAEANGKIYAIGGTSTAKVEEYDPNTNVWATKANMPTGRVYLAAASVNGKIYAIGGDLQYNGGNYTNKVEEYDPVTNTWTTKANMPTARYALSAVALNGKIYAIGGYNKTTGNLKTLEEYDPVTNTWTTKASMSQARYCFGVGVVNGKIYVVGGYTGSSYLSSVEEYDPSTDTWTTKASMPTARFALACGAANSKLYAISGNNGVNTNKVEEYNPQTNTWSTMANIPTPRRYVSGAAINSKIYVIGGLSSSGTACSTVECFIAP